MKKITLLLALSLASFSGFAQVVNKIGERSSTDYAGGSGGNSSRNTGFGIKGGLNLADIYGNGKKSYAGESNYKSFHAGVYGQYGFSNLFSVQPELLYSRQGFSGSGGDRRLDYIQAPVLLVFNFLDNVSIHVGPQVSLLTKVIDNGVDRKLANESNIYGYKYNSLDYGLAAGAEARIGPARVGARYTAGFANIVTVEDVAKTGTKAYNDIKNSVFQVYVGVGFVR